ncbi:MAG TPA: MFS transporter [Anaerolineae bacterium]|nr:MFS transporter [Anaerolineae bacterium]
MRNKEKIASWLNRLESSVDRRNFIGGLWHGAFLALGVAITQPTTVISAFMADLTGSTVWVGGLSTVLTIASALPQLFVARWIEHLSRKMPYLLAAIYIRVISWGLLSWLIFSIGDEHPITIAWALVVMLAVFYAGGGLGSIPYTDIIGKIIPSNRRGAFFGGREALAGPFAAGAALAARQILVNVAYPNNYALLFGLAAVSLTIASLGFWIIREPSALGGKQHILSWKNYWQQIQETGRRLKILIVVELLTGFSLIALPFYVIYAREQGGSPADAVGWFLLSQILGGVLSNLFWARLVDQFGSRHMLFFCAVISTMTPLIAIGLVPLGWPALTIVFFLAGATYNGRNVGFQSALLELAPAAERPTYAGLNAVLILPLAFLSFAAGIFLQYSSYTVFFLIVAAFIGAGAVVLHRWAI